VSYALLLDEMFSDSIARQLRAKDQDVLAVVADPSLVSLPDEQILAHATTSGRALVTANIKDFMPLDAQYKAAGQTHSGLILVSAKTFPQDRSYQQAVTNALAALLAGPGQTDADFVHFLTRSSTPPERACTRAGGVGGEGADLGEQVGRFGR
jgi:hypothetical protein